jgi:hypothetical protein
MTISDNAAAYTFVTVVHGADFGLMRLQARSFARYLDPGLAADIIVIDNPQSGATTPWRDLLASDYGSLGTKVRFLDARDVADIPQAMSGWFSQQILKLMASAIVTTERYLVLDGKNHLVRTLRRDQIEAPSGRPRSYLMNYETHSMRSFLVNTLNYFGLDAETHVRAFTPTTTPFVVSSELARDVVAYVVDREQRPFPDAFVYDGYKRSEFFMLAAYHLSRGESLGELYDMSGTTSPAIWPESTPAECLETITASERNAFPCFAVHRRAFPKLSDDVRRALATFWCHRGLFETPNIALAFLNNPNKLRGEGGASGGRVGDQAPPG